jgi:hypothetical protein
MQVPRRDVQLVFLAVGPDAVFSLTYVRPLPGKSSPCECCGDRKLEGYRSQDAELHSPVFYCAGCLDRDVLVQLA